MASKELTTKFEVKLEKDGAAAEMFVPGFSYSDFDRAGRISVNALAKTLESGRVLPMKRGFLNFPRLLQDGFVSMLGIHYSLDPGFLPSLRLPDNVPMKLSITLANVGKSSLTWRQTLTIYRAGTESVVATVMVKMVFIDHGTRKTRPLPTWFMQQYGHLVGSSEQLQLSAIPEVPEGAYKKSFMVHHSDMDWNQHTNNSVYLRLCLDTAAAAISQDALHGFYGDISLYPLLEMAVQYRQESFAGDALTVHLWEGGDEGALVFVIGKCSQQQPAFFARMRFSMQQYPAYSRL